MFEGVVSRKNDELGLYDRNYKQNSGEWKRRSHYTYVQADLVSYSPEKEK